MAGTNGGANRADVVVVGGGSAGCVVAARLASRSSGDVLLLEAGPDRRAEAPSTFHDGWGIERTELDWGYVSEPDGVREASPLRRKRLIGGTSWLTRFTPRGGPADYDGWKSLGNDGWGWEDVLPYFLRLETDDDFPDRPWHGDSGPMPSRRYLDIPHMPVVDLAVQALVDDGFAPIPDHNAPGAVGVGRMPMNSRAGIRVTTADAYLPTGEEPANLTIRADAQVAEILLSGSRASGVQLTDGTSIEAGEVVLCAGVYGSPAILLRSGIGPPEHLRSLDVPVRVESPGVGGNLTDHPSFYLDFGYAGEGREAPLLHSIATFHSEQAAKDRPPDLMFWISDPTGEPAEFGFEIVLLKPEGRGTVRLRSSHPLEPPAITLPRPSDFDLDRLCEGHRRAYEIAMLPEFRAHCEPPSGDASDGVLRELIQREIFSVPHTVGTCAMGSDPTAGAVVDTDGRVYGVEGLTVADASIMPEVPSGFTHIPTIMVAERLSEQIAA